MGSSSNTSSPTSAAAMAARMAGVGRVTVSLRKSRTLAAIRWSFTGLLGFSSGTGERTE